MNIHSLQQQGRGIMLGPVTIKKLWPYEEGKKSINGVVTDASGEANIRIWGATPSNGLYEGCQVTFTGTGPKGGISNKEYPEGSGKWALNCSDCRIVIGTAGGGSTEQVGYNAPEPAYQPPAQPAPQYAQPQQRFVSGAPLDKVEAVAKQAAHSTALYIEELVVNHGYTKDEAIMLAQGSFQMHPLWWFGEKGL